VKFVSRRLVILASEDVGLADPNALPLAMSAAQAAHMVGYPEALKSLCKVLDGAPKVWVSDVIISTIRQSATVAAA